MQEEKFGKLIKDIRKKYNLTQKDFADKYHVTYQAVSKWENGKNLPDISLMQKISKDYGVSIDDMIDGNYNSKKNNKKNLFLVIILIILVIILILCIILKNNDNGFESKKISSLCSDYKISGIIAYNKSKSAIYIPKIEYCGEESKIKYPNIECTLYEKNNDIIKKISSYEYNGEAITIEEFIKQVTFNVDNYLKICKSFEEDSFYIAIKAQDEMNNSFYHEVALTLEDNCN